MDDVHNPVVNLRNLHFEELDQHSGMSAGDAELRGALRVVVHVHQIHLDVIPVVIALSRNLLPPVEVSFGAVHEIERHAPVGLGAENGAGDDLTDTLFKGVDHHVTLGVLDVREHELTG